MRPAFLGTLESDGWLRPSHERESDHGHQQSGHAGPGPASTGAPGPEDRSG